jgi:CRP/FNR family transcriptional regulator, anaerobic regulatory protein
MAKSTKKAASTREHAQTPCTQCPLRKLSAFREFAPEELEFVRTFKSGELRLEAGNTIFVEGTNSPHLYTVLSGWAFKYKSLEDGRRQVLNFALPGDFIGLQASIFDSIGHSIEALTDVVLCVFPREKLWSLFEKHTGLAFDVTWLAAREESILGEYLVSVGQRNASERIAFIVLNLFQRARQSGLVRGNVVSFPFTQEQLADAVGFSLVHTNKTLKRLRKAGYFKWTGPTFEMLDEEKLTKLASIAAPIESVRPFL